MNLNPESNIVFDKYYKLSSTFKFYFFIKKNHNHNNIYTRINKPFKFFKVDQQKQFIWFQDNPWYQNAITDCFNRFWDGPYLSEGPLMHHKTVGRQTAHVLVCAISTNFKRLLGRLANPYFSMCLTYNLQDSLVDCWERLYFSVCRYVPEI